MSAHPNVILMAVLDPGGLSRRTMREIVGDEVFESFDHTIEIGDEEYHWLVMEGSYDEGFQIRAPEGSLVFFDMVTYGYGDVIRWWVLEAKKNELEVWARETAEANNCTYSIWVTANYW